VLQNAEWVGDAEVAEPTTAEQKGDSDLMAAKWPPKPTPFANPKIRKGNKKIKFKKKSQGIKKTKRKKARETNEKVLKPKKRVLFFFWQRNEERKSLIGNSSENTFPAAAKEFFHFI